jgi:hypothetical protein
MKLTTIIGTAIAAVGLAASGATVAATGAPTVAPTIAPTLAPTPTATPMPTATPPSAPTPTPALVPPPPTIFPLCQAGSHAYDWQVSSETQQDNWNIDFRNSLNSPWLFLASSNAAIDFETPSSAGKTLYVRWDSYPGAGTSTAQADTTPCFVAPSVPGTGAGLLGQQT